MIALHMHSNIAERHRVAIDVQRLDRRREILARLVRDFDLAGKVSREVRWSYRSFVLALARSSQRYYSARLTIVREGSPRELEELVADLDGEDAVVRENGGDADDASFIMRSAGRRLSDRVARRRS